MRPYNSDRVIPSPSVDQLRLRGRAESSKRLRNIVRNHEREISSKLETVTAETLPATCPLYGFQQADPTGFQHPIGCYGMMQGRCFKIGYGATRAPPMDYVDCSTFTGVVGALHDRMALRGEVPAYAASLVQLVRASKAAE